MTFCVVLIYFTLKLTLYEKFAAFWKTSAKIEVFDKNNKKGLKVRG